MTQSQEISVAFSGRSVVDAPSRSSQPIHWATSYARRLAVTDVGAIVVAVCAGQSIRFGVGGGAVLASASLVSYTAISILLALAWLSTLGMFRAREARMVGDGTEEYRRIAHASLALFGAISIVAFLFKIEIARGYLAVALPVGLCLLLAGRRAWRVWLRRRRTDSEYCSNVIVVGSHRAAIAMAKIFERERAAGYRVVGVCEPGWAAAGGSLNIDGHRVPVLGDETAVMAALHATGADIVAVSNTESLGADGMRSLAWQLEATQIDLVVSPGVIDVAGPRLQVRPVAGLPLLHVDKPQYRGASKFRKIGVDVVGSAVALLLLSPLLMLLAVVVKTTSPGPVFYRSERIGLNGRPFSMIKFRSMTIDADVQRLNLVGQNEGSGPLFKIRNDPRVTRLGRFLRRFSIDELPQLINVLCGEMSIVGPRPPLRSEVLTYTDMIHRRLLVKPGITGLWQVSGRSDLSWDESVRLDLYYVENWSFLQDLLIIWRTVKAVLRSSGAY